MINDQKTKQLLYGLRLSFTNGVSRIRFKIDTEYTEQNIPVSSWEVVICYVEDRGCGHR